MPSQPVYLWTLPMFHCNGWCYPWSVTAMAGTHVCLRAVDPAQIFSKIVEHGVTHMCGAPTVLTMLISAPEEQRRRFAHPGHGGPRLPGAAHLRHDRAAGPVDALRAAAGLAGPLHRDGAPGRALPGGRGPNRRRPEDVQAGQEGRRDDGRDPGAREYRDARLPQGPEGHGRSVRRRLDAYRGPRSLSPQ